MDYTAYHPIHGQQLRSKIMTDIKVLSGDDLTNLIHSTVKAWAEEEAHTNADNDRHADDRYVPFLDDADDRYFEMMNQLSEECFENRHNYHKKEAE